MNSNRPTTTSTSTSASSGASAESISRRAYELWEQQGRPDGQDLQHWLQAEQELTGKTSSVASPSSDARTDRPIQTARPGGGTPRETKRSSASPFAPEKMAVGNGRQAAAASRK